MVSLESEFHKGDMIVTADSVLHILKLKDGTTIAFTLYAYGKEAEKEILETINKSIEQTLHC